MLGGRKSSWFVSSVVIFIFGVGLFLHGFFLTRKELNVLSEPALHLSSASSDKRIFLFIIDALRYDFVAYQQGKVCKEGSPYNCFSSIASLLKSEPEHSALFRFVADPPTVTAQRLKGLTVGCFPTFIDAGSNLNSSAIVDDNILLQLQNQLQSKSSIGDVAERKNRIIALGDDTWKALFPDNVFDAMHMFDSFNTWDLETVDAGILSVLWDILGDGGIKNNAMEWRLLIAHFLGVDHIGHTHHAEHPLMTTRLQLMDSLIAAVIEKLPEDAVLIVFGDHGMTLAGEHGGATAEETDSALFVYSKQPFHSGTHIINEQRLTRSWKYGDGESEYISSDRSKTDSSRSIPQIDLVPTLAYLLNVPIPFSSLGKIIPELVYEKKFAKDEVCDNTAVDLELLHVLRRNVHQVLRYLLYYHRNLDSLTTGFTESTSISNEQILLSLVEMMQLALTLQEEFKQSFSASSEAILPSELLQLLQTAVTNDLRYSLLLRRSNLSDVFLEDCAEVKSIQHDYYSFLAAVQNYARQEWTEFKHFPILCGLAIMACAIITLVSIDASHLYRSSTLVLATCKTENIFATIICVALVIGNLFYVVHSFSNSFIEEEHTVCFVLLQSSILLSFLHLGHTIATNMNSRENIENNLQQLAAMLIISVVVLIAQTVVWSVAMESSSAIQMNMTVPGVLMRMTVLASPMLSLYLFWHWNNPKPFKNTLEWKSDYLCIATFALSQIFIVVYRIRHVFSTYMGCYIESIPMTILLLSLALIIFSYLTSTFSYVAPTSVPYSTNQWILTGVVHLYTLYMPTWTQHLLVLATLCTFLLFFTAVTQSFLAFKTWKNSIIAKAEISSIARSLIAFSMVMCSRFLFFVTNHACQFNRLQLQVAFIGSSHFHVIYGGLALSVNTLGHEIVVYTLVMGILRQNNAILTNNNKLSVEDDEDVSGCTHIRKMYVVYRLILMCVTCISTYCLRRHLMVWAIFAPKLVFEVAMFAAMILGVILNN